MIIFIFNKLPSLFIHCNVLFYTPFSLTSAFMFPFQKILVTSQGAPLLIKHLLNLIKIYFLNQVLFYLWVYSEHFLVWCFRKGVCFFPSLFLLYYFAWPGQIDCFTNFRQIYRRCLGMWVIFLRRVQTVMSQSLFGNREIWNCLLPNIMSCLRFHIEYVWTLFMLNFLWMRVIWFLKLVVGVYIIFAD